MATRTTPERLLGLITAIKKGFTIEAAATKNGWATGTAAGQVLNRRGMSYRTVKKAFREGESIESIMLKLNKVEGGGEPVEKIPDQLVANILSRIGQMIACSDHEGLKTVAEFTHNRLHKK